MIPKEKKPCVMVPEGISISYQNEILSITKGSKQVSKHLANPSVKIEVNGKEVTFIPQDSKRLTKAVVNSFMAHVQNLIQGLEKGYTYKLAIVHSHFPMNVKVKSDLVEIANYLGEKNPRLARIVGKETKVEIKGKEIIVNGNNLEEVSQTAANMEKATRDTKKDQRVFQDGIYITKKGVHA